MRPGKPPPKIGPGTSAVAPITPVGLTTDPLGQVGKPGGLQVTSTPAKTSVPSGAVKPARAERFVPVKLSLNVVPPTEVLPVQLVQSNAEFHILLPMRPSNLALDAGTTCCQVPAPKVGVPATAFCP